MADIWEVRKRLPLLCAVLTAVAFLAGAVVSRAADATPTRTSFVRVVERDFHIGTTHGRVTPGTVVFRVTNHGPDKHEFIVIRVGASGGLPLRPDGITVDEEALDKSIVGSIEPASAGHTNTLRLTLKAGRYALICNMFGHYMGGMYAPLTVR